MLIESAVGVLHLIARPGRFVLANALVWPNRLKNGSECPRCRRRRRRGSHRHGLAAGRGGAIAGRSNGAEAVAVNLTINGTQHALAIDPRTTLRVPTKILASPPMPLRRPQPRP